jgi:hypothetical protein
MAQTHVHHPHNPGPGCGHMGIRHGEHVDYVHDGHLHRQRPDGTVEEPRIPVDENNPAEHNPIDRAKLGHEPGHVHGPDCGHEAVPHGDHTCYIVDGRLHYPHAEHCDDHGPVEVVQEPEYEKLEA